MKSQVKAILFLAGLLFCASCTSGSSGGGFSAHSHSAAPIFSHQNKESNK